MDANIFIHAYWKPRKKIIAPKTKWMKAEAKNIVTQINNQENLFCISLLQMSEIANILKSAMTWDQLKDFLWGLISNPSIDLVEISKAQFISAVDKITEFGMDPNDITAYLIMQEKEISEIFTFDQHFGQLPGITVLPLMPDFFNGE
ncbi:MAG TPA: PIN domain-containing protein [Candidatus Lokiarchaeia archaeon]|nr:PIN domain-containing protein [Candidatus Lokiarchaeia archaeon]